MMELTKKTPPKGTNQPADAVTNGSEQPTPVSQDLAQVVNQQQEQIVELVNTIQRTRADFENYRKHVEVDLAQTRSTSQQEIITKLLPIIDVLDTAMTTVPENIATNAWVKGLVSLRKNLTKMTAELNLARQIVKPGDIFDHNQHEAISLDETGSGDKEVVAEVLRPGYLYGDQLLRPAMVKVKRA